MDKPEKTTAKKPSFEESIKRLEEIVRTLEKGDTPLENSIKLFEEGIKLSGVCNTLLENAEQKVTKLIKSDDGQVVEEPMADMDNEYA